MAEATREVVFIISGQDGASLEDAQVTATLSDYDIDQITGDMIAPATQAFFADANGQVVMTLWPNARGTRSTKYLFSVFHPETGRRFIEDAELSLPDNDVTFTSLLLNSVNVLPTATFTMTPMSGEAPLDITLDATDSVDSDGSIASFTWFLDGVQIGTGAILSATITNDGTHVISLTVTDNHGATRTVQQSIAVSAAVGPVAGFSITTPHIAPYTVTPVSTAVEGSTNIVLTEYDYGINTGFTTNGSQQYTQGGTYTITQRVTDENGLTDTISHTLVITVIAPTAGFTITSPHILPYTVSPVSTASAGSSAIVLTEYDYGDGNGFTTSASCLYEVEGDYAITQRVTDAQGLKNIVTHVLTLYLVAPIAGLVIPDTADNNDLITPTDQSGDGSFPIVSVEWDFGDGDGYDVTGSHTYATPGTYTISQRVTDSKGNVNTASKQIVITDYIAGLVAAVAAAGPTAAFTATPSSGAGPYLSVTLDPSSTTISGYSEALALVTALPNGATKTAYLATLSAAIADLAFSWNYAA